MTDTQAKPDRGAPGPSTGLWLLGGVFVIGLLWTLRATMMVTLPVVCAVFIALAVWPLCRWVQHRVPAWLSWLGYVAAMLVVVGLLALFVAGLAIAARQVTGDGQHLIPQLQERLTRSPIAAVLDERQLAAALQGMRNYAGSLLRATWNTVAGVVLILFLVLLMLTEGRDWRAKLEAAAGGRGREWAEAGALIGARFRRYFLTRLLLGAITGALYVAWLALFGVDFLPLWGMLALLLNYIPNVGSLIAGALPVFYAVVQKDAGTAAVIAAGLLAIEQVMGNYVDPKLVGRQLSISPLVVIVALLVWTWVWGVPGSLLAAPITVLMIIVFAHIPALRPVALLLSNERDLAGLEENVERRAG